MENFKSVGRLVANPELKVVASGKRVAKATIAYTGPNKTGEDREGKPSFTSFIDVTAWEERADQLMKFEKANNVEVEGNIYQRRWKDESGKTRSTYELNVQTVKGYVPETSKEA